MGVHVLYRGNFGNLMFQYVCARLFAERNGLRLETPFPEQDLVRMLPHADRRRVEEPTVFVTDAHEDPLGMPVWSPARHVFDGYFQKSAWYHDRRAQIERFARPAEPERRSARDIVVNLRVGEDYKALKWVISPSWYLGILAQEKFDTLHVVADARDEEYLQSFARYRPVVVSSGPKGDWEYIRSFDRIVCSNSSFSWWAAFFSRASRVYTFKRWVRHPGGFARIGPFPNGLEVDGPFMGEGP